MGLGQMVAGGLSYKNNKGAQKDSRNASRDLTRRMGQSAADIGAYRPEAAEARMRALRARLGVLEPMNSLTGEITGRPAADMSGLGTSPLSMNPLPSQASIYGADGKIDGTKLRSYGIDPNDPNAQSLLGQKLQGYGYNMPQTPTQQPPAQPFTRTVRRVK